MFPNLQLNIYRRLSSRTVATSPSINTLVQQGHYIQALHLYSGDPLHTTQFTYPSLLKACASLSHLPYGKTIHASIITRGFFSDPYITSSLVNMYVKSGSLRDALQVFDELLQREGFTQDVTIWNSLIDAYFTFGQFLEGIAQFRQMQLMGNRPDAFSLCILLGERDGHLGYAERKQIHAYILRNMLFDDPFLESSLIGSYFNHGRPMDAWRLFQLSGGKNSIVTWNVMIGGFCDNGLWQNSLELYASVKNEKVKLVSATFTSSLSASCHGEDAAFGEQVHCDVIKLGFEHDPYINTSLLTMYSRCKLVQEAEKVFDHAPKKNTELWNAMMSAYLGSGCAYDALKAYKQMRLHGILPDCFTVSNVLTCSSIVGSYDFCRSIHAQLIKGPILHDMAVQSALLTMYSTCTNTDDANLVFRSIKKRDVVAWGSMISGFCQNGKYEEALGVFREMEANGVKPDSNILATVVTACTGLEAVNLGSAIQGHATKTGWEQDVFIAASLIDMYSKCGLPEMAESVFSLMLFENLVAWNSMISCYSRNGLPEMSISTFSQLMHCGLYPDSLSITSVLVAISSMAALLKGKTVHAYLIRFGIPLDAKVENALIDMYVKCGLLRYAQNIFRIISRKNSVMWNSMIAGYGLHGECLKAIRLFDEMRSSGSRPDDITFLSLLSSCNHSGLTEEGLNLFQLMRVDYGIEPTMEHYASIVDLLGRAGRLDDAYEFLKNMPVEPDRSVWLSLLWSCRAHGRVELGALAAQQLLKMEPSRSSHYIQTLNFCGEVDSWDNAASVMELMRERKLKKSPGCSWIEVRNRVHAFVSGDCSSPKTIDIYVTLRSLKVIMIRERVDEK